MATISFTVQRGERALGDVAVGAGSAEAQTDTISVNIDTTTITKAEAMLALDQVKAEISRGNWPPA